MSSTESDAPLDTCIQEKTKMELDQIHLEAALGHKQELNRHFGLFSLTSLGIVIAKYGNLRSFGHCNGWKQWQND